MLVGLLFLSVLQFSFSTIVGNNQAFLKQLKVDSTDEFWRLRFGRSTQYSSFKLDLLSIIPPYLNSTLYCAQFSRPDGTISTKSYEIAYQVGQADRDGISSVIPTCHRAPDSSCTIPTTTIVRDRVPGTLLVGGSTFHKFPLNYLSINKRTHPQLVFNVAQVYYPGQEIQRPQDLASYPLIGLESDTGERFLNQDVMRLGFTIPLYVGEDYEGQPPECADIDVF